MPMLLTALSGSELLPLLIIGIVAIVIFTVAIMHIVSSAQEAGKQKQMAQDNAKAYSDLRKADKVVLSSVGDDMLISKLRSGKF